MSLFKISPFLYRLLFVLVLSIGPFAILSGQKVTVSDEIQLRNDLSYDLVGKVDSLVVLFRDRGNKYEIKTFDNNLKHKEDIEINLSDKGCTILATIPRDTSFFVMYSYRSRGCLLYTSFFIPVLNIHTHIWINRVGYYVNAIKTKSWLSPKLIRE